MNIEGKQPTLRAVIQTEKSEQKHQEDLQRLKEFRLLDDDFMTKCFDGHTECIELVLQIILERPDLKIENVRTQVFVENLLRRSVCLDILATDDVGRKYNIEIQRTDRGAGRKRARYNSSMIDTHLLEKSAGFDDLPETFVVFITERDVVGHGKPLYCIERCICGTDERFNDGTHILYVNGAYRGESSLGQLMHDFSCTDPSDMHYRVLAERARYFKETKEGVAIMCKSMEDMRDQTWRESMVEVVLRMLDAGTYNLNEITEISGLPLEEVKKLSASRSAYISA